MEQGERNEVLVLTSHLPHLRFFDLSEDEGKRKTTMRGEGKEVFGVRLDKKTKGCLRCGIQIDS